MTSFPRIFLVLAAMTVLAVASAFALDAAPALSAQSYSPPFHQGGGILGGPDGYADEPEDIIGAIQGNQYISPTGTFRVTIPIIPDLGGQITDSPNVVTFQDDYGEHASIGCFPIDESLRAEEARHAGRKEFLVWFFQNFVQSDFARSVPGTSAEPNARFINGTQDGTLFTQLLLPNGSVFAERAFVFPPRPPHVAKRGNFVFVNNDHIYVLSTELADRIFEHSTYNKTSTEEEEILRRRLNDMLAGITFIKRPAAGAPAGAAPPAPVPSVGPAPAPAPATTTPATQ